MSLCNGRDDKDDVGTVEWKAKQKGRSALHVQKSDQKLRSKVLRRETLRIVVNSGFDIVNSGSRNKTLSTSVDIEKGIIVRNNSCSLPCESVREPKMFLRNRSSQIAPSPTINAKPSVHSGQTFSTYTNDLYHDDDSRHELDFKYNEVYDTDSEKVMKRRETFMTSTTTALDRAIGGVFGDIIDSSRNVNENEIRTIDAVKSPLDSERMSTFRCEQVPSPTFRLPSRPRHSFSMYLFFIVNGLLFVFFVAGGIVFIILEEKNQ